MSTEQFYIPVTRLLQLKKSFKKRSNLGLENNFSSRRLLLVKNIYFEIIKELTILLKKKIGE